MDPSGFKSTEMSKWMNDWLDAVEQETLNAENNSETRNETMHNADDEEVNSETSSDLYIVDIYEADAECNVDDNESIPQTSDSVDDTSHNFDISADYMLQTDSRDDSLSSSVGASASQSHPSDQFQPFVKVQRLDPEEIRRLMKPVRIPIPVVRPHGNAVRAAAGHPDDSRRSNVTLSAWEWELKKKQWLENRMKLERYDIF